MCSIVAIITPFATMAIIIIALIIVVARLQGNKAPDQGMTALDHSLVASAAKQLMDATSSGPVLDYVNRKELRNALKGLMDCWINDGLNMDSIQQTKMAHIRSRVWNSEDDIMNYANMAALDLYNYSIVMQKEAEKQPEPATVDLTKKEEHV